MKLSDIEKINDLIKQRDALKKVQEYFEQPYPYSHVTVKLNDEKYHGHKIAHSIVTEVESKMQETLKAQITGRVARELSTVNVQLLHLGVDTKA